MTTRAIRIAILLLLAGLVSMVGKAQDPFAPEKQLKPPSAAIDPFALEHQYQGPGVVKVEPKNVEPKKNELGVTAKAFLEKLALKVRIEPAQAKRGEIVKLIIEGTPTKGNYTYALTKKTPDTRTGNIPVITVAAPAVIQQLYPPQEQPEPTPKTQKVGKKQETLLTHKGPFTWTQPLRIKTDAPLGPAKLPIELELMVCNEARCDGPDLYPGLEGALTVLDGAPAQPNLAQFSVKPSAPTLVGGADPGKTPAPGTNSSSDFDPNNLPALLLFAFIGAILMLLTPCVFPMIPITVNFFIKQSEKEHHRPLRVASVYAGTIIVLLTVTMMFLGKTVVELAENEWFNLAMGGVLIFFALSLFGMYEIELPQFLARYTSAREGQGGSLGAVFMALTFTITSFTCTGPFMGILLTGYAELKPPFVYQLLASLVYSITFAAPFFVLALFPSMLKKLPKSGGWMNSIKVVMGFLEVGAALKFIATADYAIFRGQPKLFTFDVVICSWIAISFACGLYLLGQFRLPHDDPTESVGVLRMIFGTIFLGLTLYMLPILFGGRPSGIIGEGLLAFLPPRPIDAAPANLAFNGAKQGGNSVVDSLPWHKDYPEAWEAARKDNNLMFFDFTGVYCTNCRANEENVFPLNDVLQELKNYTLVKLFCDIVPNPKLSGSEAKAQARRNKQWREAFLKGKGALPSYVIFRPDPDTALDANGIPKGEVLGYREDLIRDKDSFVAFLREHAAVAWHRDFSEAWREARVEGKLMLVDFPAAYSTRSMSNLENVFPRRDVASKLKHFSRARLWVDHIPGWKEGETEARAKHHLEMKEHFRRNVAWGYWLPCLIARPGDGQPFLVDGKPNIEVVDVTGDELDPDRFVQFLDKNLSAQVARQ